MDDVVYYRYSFPKCSISVLMPIKSKIMQLRFGDRSYVEAGGVGSPFCVSCEAQMARCKDVPVKEPIVDPPEL
jgi:hypothetical protein